MTFHITYFLMLIILLVTSYYEEKTIIKTGTNINVTLSTIVFISFILLIGCLSAFLNDWVTYELMYDNIKTTDVTNLMTLHPHIEVGYLGLMKILSYLNSYFISHVIIFGFCLYAMIVFASEHSKNMSITMSLMLIFVYHTTVVTYERQVIALGIFLLFGYKYLLERKLLKYILIIMIAMLFHKTAIFLFIIYFIPKKPLKNIYFIGLWLGMMLGIIILDRFALEISSLFAFSSWISSHIMFFQKYSHITIFKTLGSAVFFGVLLGVLVIRNQNKKDYLYNLSILSIMLVSTAFILTTTLDRLGEYIIIFYFVSITNLYSERFKNNQKLWLSPLIILCIFSLRVVKVSLTSPMDTASYTTNYLVSYMTGTDEHYSAKVQRYCSFYLQNLEKNGNSVLRKDHILLCNKSLHTKRFKEYYQPRFK